MQGLQQGSDIVHPAASLTGRLADEPTFAGGHRPIGKQQATPYMGLVSTYNKKNMMISWVVMISYKAAG